MPGSDCDVLVVGAGVSGLTTAICLAEAGVRVTVRTAAPPGETTSSVAGAIWGPHLVEVSERATRWRRETLAVLRDLAGDPAAGVRIGTGVEAVRGTTAAAGVLPGAAAVPPAAAGADVPGTAAAAEPVPEWLADLGGATWCGPDDLPDGFASGWRYSAPMAHMPSYLGYLLARFDGTGGRVTAGAVGSLPVAAREHGAAVVVNCTGAAAHHLVPDPAVTPVRGQVVVAANPGIEEFFIGPADATADLMYLFPHGDTVVLGGTEMIGDWTTEPVPAVAERILADCAAVEPRLRGARVLAHRVGLRPVRPLVRLEAAASGGAGRPVVVHNYGHGGAGMTLSWGCAREAAGLVTRHLGR